MNEHDIDSLDDFLRYLRAKGYRPPIERSRQHSSIEEIRKHTWPASPEEAERFVEMIYADRRACAVKPLPE